MTVREPRFTERDRLELLALAVHRDDLCPGGCGQPLSESATKYEDGAAEYDGKGTTCRACAAREEAQRAFADRSPDARARLWYVVKLPRG